MPPLTKAVFNLSLTLAWRDGYRQAGGEDPDSQDPDITQFDARKSKSNPSVKAAKPDPTIRQNLPYDSSKCDRRVWNDGLGAQCSRNKGDDGIHCSGCSKSVVRNGCVPFG